MLTDIIKPMITIRMEFFRVEDTLNKERPLSSIVTRGTISC